MSKLRIAESDSTDAHHGLFLVTAVKPFDRIDGAKHESHRAEQIS
jgi:hypothetical protein